MLVLGAGLQGAACAFDLLQNPAVDVVRLADLNVSRLPAFLAPYADPAAPGGAGPRLRPTPLDMTDTQAVRALMRQSDAVMSALPYYFNGVVARHAVECGAHFCDLGGNTEIVFEQQRLDAAARANGVSVVPDSGLAPGIVNVLAQYGIDLIESDGATVLAVRMFVGGLPQNPEPPLNYQIVYSLEGVLDFYTSLAWVLRGGQRTRVLALSEVEPVEFGDGIGTLEAFHTAGGLSTMGDRYEGKISTMEYKTLRYPGHAQIMEAIRQLGLFDLEPVEVTGRRVVPRDVAVAVMGPRLTKPHGKDVVALRVVVEGTKAGQRVARVWELVDRYDESRGISAMMRTTGYSLAITGVLQASGHIRPGVRTPHEAVDAPLLIEALAHRGIRVREVSPASPPPP